MSSVLSTVPSVNGTSRLPRAKAKAKPRRKPGKAMVQPMPRLAFGLTVGAGIGIPALTLSLSTIAGQLLRSGRYGLGGSTAVVCCTVLAVSLAHLAWAVQDITRSPRWASWLLAVTAASMALNVWAFLRHGK